LADKNTIRPIVCAALLAAIFYFCFFSGLGAVGLVGPDEPRYAAIAREMASSGDWVTPRLFGQPWFEKPALYYWSAALAFRAGLTNETAARLPSGIFALLATLGLAWAARRTYGGRTAVTLLLMLPTCAGMIGFAHAAATDMPFAACLTLAMIAGAQVVWEKKGAGGVGSRAALPWVWECAWGFFLGFATLAKGPAALALAAGSVALWVIATRRWRDALRLFNPAGIATFLLTALPWYVLCAARNPTFMRVFLLEHNLERFATNRYQHAQPFWFFAPVLLLALFPWTSLLGACGKDALRVYREKRLADSPGVFFAAWAIFPFLFFSLSQSKLPGYILPAVPPLLLLVARSISRAEDERDTLLRWWMAGVGACFLLLGFGAGIWIARPEEIGGLFGGDKNLGMISGLWIVIVGLLTAAAALRRKQLTVTVVAAIFVTSLVAASTDLLLPILDSQISPRAAARAAEPRGGGAGLAIYKLPRAWNFGVNFYAGREIPEWTPGQPFRTVITNEAGSAELTRIGIKPQTELRISRQALILGLR
jgi:4-amino-4-deoxy-L-arabinose transferase-like glycosyltransferase